MSDKLAVTALLVLLASAMSCASLLDMKCVREGTEDEARAWFAKGDTDDDGVISDAEFTTWESRLRLQIRTFLFEYNDDQFFTDADVNQDGALTKEEIDDETQVMFAGADVNFVPNEVDSYSELLDSDNDGLVTRDELICGFDAIRASCMALMNMFAAVHDEDQRCQVGDDGMDLDKLEECLNNLKVKNENTDAEMEAWFAKGDMDSDGTITSQEFDDWESSFKLQMDIFLFQYDDKKFFNDGDADQDGFLDNGEIQEETKRMFADNFDEANFVDGEIESYVERLDYNKDGKVSFEELVEGFDALRSSCMALLNMFAAVRDQDPRCSFEEGMEVEKFKECINNLA